ncbi:MAG TPA: glycosyltransferase family 9 protein [Verrucomicrobiales bacterium]|nr:glycosyltransferase family 9 protein [Verrucomicrobiales bacterium]
MNLSACERILIVKPSSLGDIVHTLPAAEALHRAAPQAKIDWLVNTEWCPILEGVPFLNRLVPFPRRELKGITGLFRGTRWAGKELRPRGYDIAIDFQGLLRSAFLAKLTGASTLAGFRNSREGASLFYHHRAEVPDWNRRHAVDRNLALAATLGADISNPVFVFPPGGPTQDLPALSLPPILLHPFSRGIGKSLSVPEVIDLCERLAPYPVLLVGVPEKTVTVNWPENVVDLLGKTSLPGLIGLIRLAAWTVSVDSGPMHLAAGLTDRVLSLHTWSNPAMVGPWRADAWVWRESRIVQVRDLKPNEFPERRDLQRHFGAQERLLNHADLVAITAFLQDRLSATSPG